MILYRGAVPLKPSIIEDKRSSRVVAWGAYLAILVAALQLSCLAGAQAKTAPRSEIVFHTWERQADWPVYIDHLELDGKFIPWDTPVPVEQGWLKKLVVVVENSSPKTVVEGGVQIDFPETGLGTPNSPILATASNLGQYPSYARYLSARRIQKWPQRPAIKVPPGGTLDFPFPDAAIEGTEAEARRKVGQVTKVTVKLLGFYFEDSSLWMSNDFFMPGTQPGKWKRVSAQEFLDAAANRK